MMACNSHTLLVKVMAVKNAISETGVAADRRHGGQMEGPSELPELCLGATKETVLGQEDVSRKSPSEISPP